MSGWIVKCMAVCVSFFSCMGIVFMLWTAGGWAAGPYVQFPPPGLSHHSLGFPILPEGVCPRVAALLHHRRECRDAVLGISSAVVSMTTWHPSSSPEHLLGLPFHGLAMLLPLPSTPGHCASVLHLPRHSTTVPIGSLLLKWHFCLSFILVYVPMVS